MLTINVAAVFYAQDHEDACAAACIRFKQDTIVADTKTIQAGIDSRERFGMAQRVRLPAKPRHFSRETIGGGLVEDLQIVNGVR